MRRVSILLQSVLYTGAGIMHVVNPAIYLRIMPPWLPAPALLVAVSGVAEIALGILLLFPKTRRPAAWGIIALLMAVFPANVQMAVNWHREAHPHEWIAWLRLPLQVALVWWAWLLTQKKVDV